ncbi:hypothetical protein AgCh_033805 [Apium graveolens]
MLEVQVYDDFQIADKQKINRMQVTEIQHCSLFRFSRRLFLRIRLQAIGGVRHAGRVGGLVIVRDLDLFSSASRACFRSRLNAMSVMSHLDNVWGFRESKGRYLGLLRFRGIDIEESCSRVSGDGSWCPSQNIFKMEPANLEMVNAVVTSVIQSLGKDPLREELLGTPTRFVKWLMNFRNNDSEMKLHGLDRYIINLFKSNGNNDQTEESIQSELNLSIWSQCEHHLLPFYGVVHIGYIGTGIDATGLSLLQSIVHFHGFKLQVQERLTRKIAETVSSLVGKDVMVVVECNHTCMISKGIEKFGSSTATMAVLGRFSR